MLSPSQHDLAQSESSNFFQRPGASCGSSTKQTIKLRAVLQDAYTLQKLAEFQDVSQFLNNNPTTDSCHLSAMAALAGNISQSLEEMVGCASHEPSTKKADTQPNRSKPPLSNTASPKRCYRCGVTETPRWRRMSPGCPRLCNFCSLVESRRARRKNSRFKSSSVSTRFSWPC
ncbi:hypothetical protein LB507_009239 [Fusarium sp. FIESC RH6]|nr:hypothetical protein LB507_009239 [Fusarium sp. FIESC RH6]